MTNPREEQVRGIFNTLSTEGQETLTSARGAVDRLTAQIGDMTATISEMQAGEVSQATVDELQSGADALKVTLDDAQAAFDAVGVPATPPADGGDTPVQAKKRGKK